MTNYNQDSLYYTVLEIAIVLMCTDLKYLWDNQSFETKTCKEETDCTDVSPNVTLKTTYTSLVFS